MGNVEVTWEDVVSVLNLIRGHIGALAALLAAMVAAIVSAAVKLKKPLKGFVQWQSQVHRTLVFHLPQRRSIWNSEGYWKK